MKHNYYYSTSVLLHRISYNFNNLNLNLNLNLNKNLKLNLNLNLFRRTYCVYYNSS